MAIGSSRHVRSVGFATGPYGQAHSAAWIVAVLPVGTILRRRGSAGSLEARSFGPAQISTPYWTPWQNGITIHQGQSARRAGRFGSGRYSHGEPLHRDHGLRVVPVLVDVAICRRSEFLATRRAHQFSGTATGRTVSIQAARPTKFYRPRGDLRPCRHSSDFASMGCLRGC
jgi:hypothetical protein